MTAKTVAIIGGGPAGLMAAEALSASGMSVTLYEAMPSVGRKFLMAGRGGLNLTHSEERPAFDARYGAAASRLTPILDAFTPTDLIAWAQALGQETFVGGSGRVFPKTMKASPLLRAWLARLAAQNVEIRTRSRWTGWNPEGALTFADGATARPDAVVLALGGASWPRLGSTGEWAGVLADQGVGVSPFRPANVGFDVAWSDIFRDRFEGHPLKAVAMTHGGERLRGDAMITRYGLEGGVVYALSAGLRDAIERQGSAKVWFDLRPDIREGKLTERLSIPHGGQSLATYLRKTLKLSPLEINLLREAHGRDLPTEPRALAGAIKGAPITLTGVQPIARAISSAGGVALDTVDEALMLRAKPGVFVAGEMLDWEAPTGGYLLQASFASGVVAARGVLAFLT